MLVTTGCCGAQQVQRQAAARNEQNRSIEYVTPNYPKLTFRLGTAVLWLRLLSPPACGGPQGCRDGTA